MRKLLPWNSSSTGHGRLTSTRVPRPTADARAPVALVVNTGDALACTITVACKRLTKLNYCLDEYGRRQ